MAHKKMTARAKKIMRKIERVTRDDHTITIGELAKALRIHPRNTRKWLRVLEACDALECSKTLVSRKGKKPILINSIRPKNPTYGPVIEELRGGAPPPPICFNSFNNITNTDINKKEIKKGGAGGNRDLRGVPSHSPAQEPQPDRWAALIADMDAQNAAVDRRPPGWETALPPYPSTARLRSRVLSPPQPVFGTDDARNVILIIRGFRCVYKHHTHKTARIDKQANYRMRKVIAEMKKHEIIHPYAWAMFRWRQWSYGRSQDGIVGGVPTIDSIFAAPLIAPNAEWYHSRKAAYLGRIDGSVPSARELVRRWNMARDLLASHPDQSRLEDRRMVSEILPPHTYADLSAKVRTEVQDAAAEWTRRFAAGEWVWGL